MSDLATWDAIKRLEEAHAALTGDFQRLEDRVDRLSGEANRVCVTLAALESPAAAPDPEFTKCADCGHKESDHIATGCLVGDLSDPARCRCFEFVPMAEPEPAPLDPVLVGSLESAIEECARRGFLWRVGTYLGDGPLRGKADATVFPPDKNNQSAIINGSFGDALWMAIEMYDKEQNTDDECPCCGRDGAR